MSSRAPPTGPTRRPAPPTCPASTARTQGVEFVHFDHIRVRAMDRTLDPPEDPIAFIEAAPSESMVLVFKHHPTWPISSKAERLLRLYLEQLA